MDEDEIKYNYTCKYCGHQGEFNMDDLAVEDDITIDDAIKYDLELPCDNCGVPNRVSEAMDEDELEELGW